MNGDMIGRVIKNRYKLIDERGRGSFATVYVARDTENNHIYAVKVMHLELSNDGELLARFQREAHILLNLHDTHIVRIVDYGNDTNMPFIVMDYIDGQNLKYHMITQGPMEPLRALNYTRQIAEGLDTAYKQGVVHRDIKPQNILIDNKDDVKIIDFGFSTCIPNDKKIKIFCGTPSYMAPEIVQKIEYAGPPADIWALGVLLFTILSGCFPYRGATDKELYKKIMRAEYRLPSEV